MGVHFIQCRSVFVLAHDTPDVEALVFARQIDHGISPLQLVQEAIEGACLLEKVLARIYDAERMASMVLAHFSGLHHVAVGGLIPVIEGAGRRLAGERGLDEKGHVKEVFRGLASYVKEDVIKRRNGATEEIVNMLDSFLLFTEDYFYCKSQAYPLGDGTNRHGIEPTRMLSMEGRSIPIRPSRQ